MKRNPLLALGSGLLAVLLLFSLSGDRPNGELIASESEPTVPVRQLSSMEVAGEELQLVLEVLSNSVRPQLWSPEQPVAALSKGDSCDTPLDSYWLIDWDGTAPRERDVVAEELNAVLGAQGYQVELESATVSGPRGSELNDVKLLTLTGPSGLQLNATWMDDLVRVTIISACFEDEEEVR